VHVVRVLGRFLATGRQRGAHVLDIVARVPLEPRRSLYVVEVAGKTLLVGTSEMGLSVLSELDGSTVRAAVVERPTFAELVRAAWQRRRGRRDGPKPPSSSAPPSSEGP
jgi:flagellar biogenesis protein FliO